ncbi:hypothetical protein BDZ89DRAFT_1141358 [Hymenopellis radicata]|nr:hypothetical protein BDZ89DRAFT_1141358 [Hymenopellis radicata]
MDPEAEDPVYHAPEFQAPDADVCIVYSDDILFRVHSTNPRDSEATCFESCSSTSILGLPSNLGMLPFRTLEEVATTADKYQFLALVQSAIDIWSKLSPRFMAITLEDDAFQ